jgi:rifampicin phosphotransferase
MHERWITDWPPSKRFPHYTRANAGEVLAGPATPLGQQFTFDHAVAIGWRDGYVRQGCYDLSEFDPDLPDTCGFFGSYFYINLATVRMQGARSPILTVEQLDTAFFGNHPDVPPYVPHPDDHRPDMEPAIMAHLGWVMSTTAWPKLDEEKAAIAALRADRPDLSTQTDGQLVARARLVQPWLQTLFDSHTVTSSSSGIAPGILFAVGQAIGDPSIPMKLLAGLGDVDSAEPSYAIWDLSRQVAASPELTAAFDAGVDGLADRLHDLPNDAATAFAGNFDRFLYDFGSRGPNEWELSAEVWENRPELALAMIDRARFQTDEESPRRRNAGRVQEREALTSEVRARVAALGPELAGQFEGAMVAAHQLAFRERSKSTIVRALHEARQVFRELARRHAADGTLQRPEHLFMLLDTELESFVASPSTFTQTLADRYDEWKTLADLEPPYFITDGVVPPLSQWTRKGEAQAEPCTLGEVLHGVAGCAGVATGRARVILDPSDPGAMEPGDVLVAPSTDPAWTPLFMPASAVVVNVGGQISHSIIVCRELGLPCVVSVTDATLRIPDGAIVEVDGAAGTVTVLQLPAP